MAQPTAKTSLSLPARLALYLGPPATVLLISAASPIAGLLTPLAFLPAAALYRAYTNSVSRAQASGFTPITSAEIPINGFREPSRHANLEPLVWTTLISSTAGIAIAGGFQAILGYGCATALFGNGETRDFFMKEAMRASLDGLNSEDIAQRAALASSWQNTAFNATFSFVGAAITEEALKYLPVAYCRRLQATTGNQEQRRSRASLDYALAWGLGIGLVEAIGGIYTSVTDPQSTWPKITLTVAERLILGASAHLITAALSSLRSIRKDQSSLTPGAKRGPIEVLSIIGPSVFMHGANNFGLFSFSAWNGNIGFIHPTRLDHGLAMLGMYITALGATTWLARRELRMIDEAEKKQA